MTATIQPPARDAVSAPARRAPLERVNPATRILMTAILALPLFASIDWVSSAVAVALMLAAIPLSGLPLALVARRLAPIAAFAPIAGVSMLLYAEPGGRIHLSFWFATISDDSIALAIAVTLRVLALGIPTILLFSRLDATELADALTQVWRMPDRLVFGVLAGARMLGLFLDDWRSMELARRARGVGDAGRLRRAATMAFVLLVFAVRRGTKLATAMEARGFGAPGPRSRSRRSRVGAADPLAILGSCLVMALALGAAVAAGTFQFIWS
ncbi:energy-coupling factor transporter transmembrane component T family protein [Homoserinibacter sp. YIM 151385]|uniref:energy-coupling factor transporter transmembrane component T family protein n=1 Tax=Homoserinibacter sp. YIM 151385 TaxID=2985506 RepID=UPI0022F11B80|nr:energy-coupling factor transporter transmembrane component T [Homoserinibacter sp. YIM 151385]WBU39067.1 energy-coupling factor transporter transmembrane component T [Homoserinibacter sp. YIM 151385]